MAKTIPADEQVFMVSKSTNTTYSGSASLKAMSEWYTMDDVSNTVKPYKVFTALLTQNGGDDPAVYSSGSGPLIIGGTYKIFSNDSDTADFTNVGAPNNNEGTYFIATGAVPNSWGAYNNGQLNYNNGAPVATVLENTIGNIWFTYQSPGIYKANFSTEQDINKLYTSALPSYNNDYNFIGTYFSTTGAYFVILNTLFAESDGYLNQTPIEIRVYN